MSFRERLKAIELLWESIASEPDAIHSPDWHKEVLSKRKKNIESGKTNFIPLKDLKTRLLQNSA